MPVGTLAPQGANRCRNKGIGCSNKTHSSVFCKWLNRSGYRGSGFKFTVLGCKIRAVVKSVASMGAAHDQILPWTVTRKYLGKLVYDDFFEFYHHGIIHNFTIALLFQ